MKQLILGLKKAIIKPKRVKKLQKNKRATLTDLELYGKTVLLRCDFNVPISDSKDTKKIKVLNNFKIKQSLPTIKELLKKRCKIVIISHLKDPKEEHDPSLSLKPIAKELAKMLPKKTIHFFDNCIGGDVKKQITKTKQGQIIVLENLRYYKEEKEGDLSFAHSLAELADYYVFDAFGVSHRKNTSTTLLPAFIPTAAGLLLQDEIDTLHAAMKFKDKSLWVMGGAKLYKISVIESGLKHAEKVFVAGALCFSFLRAKKIHVGQSLTSTESIQEAKKILKLPNANKIILPVDFICAKSMQENAKTYVVNATEIPSDVICLDIGPKSREILSKLTKDAKQIVWNGPLGYAELPQYRTSTNQFFKDLKETNVRIICGGGETAELIDKYKMQNKVTHVSTGGGAALHFLSGKHLPALDALSKSAKKFKLIK